MVEVGCEGVAPNSKVNGAVEFFLRASNRVKLSFAKEDPCLRKRAPPRGDFTLQKEQRTTGVWTL